MSVHEIYYQDRAKKMRPVTQREQYVALRDSERQKRVLAAVRGGDTRAKSRLLQMNYSCLPGEDGALKGCRTPSRSVGMDIDFKAPEGLTAEERQAWLDDEMARVPARVLSLKDELGLLLLERSATKGYHLVFRRRLELSQEENLRWASSLLGVAFDGGAKDITRVFFTTTADEGELLFLDDELFDNAPVTCGDPSAKSEAPQDAATCLAAATPLYYQGI